MNITVIGPVDGVGRILEIPIEPDERDLLCRSAEAAQHNHRRFVQ